MNKIYYKINELKKNYDHLESLYNDSFIQVQAYKNTVKTLELQKDWYHKTQIVITSNKYIKSMSFIPRFLTHLIVYCCKLV